MVAIPPLVSGYGVVQQRVHPDASNPGQGAAAPVSPSPPAPADPLLALLDATLKSAAVRQNGLAPLYADLTAFAARTDLPPALRAAVGAVLSLQLPAGEAGAQALRAAVARSGLFLEAALATGQAGAPARRPPASRRRRPPPGRCRCRPPPPRCSPTPTRR